MKGFSLIEILIVVAIVGIIAAIGYPTYRHHVQKTQQKQAKLMLFELANKLEHHFLEHESYEDMPNTTIQSNPSYQIGITSLTDNTFTLEAIPKNHTQPCEILTLNQLGKFKKQPC